MKIEDQIYIKVLVWAYENNNSGFTREDLRNSLFLNSAEMNWIERTFFPNPQNSYSLIVHLESNNGKNFFTLSDRGMSEAINYLTLREAQKGSKRAERIALSSIVISAVVGLVQIILTIFCK